MNHLLSPPHKVLTMAWRLVKANATSINILTDNVLLEIFDLYRKNDDSDYHVWKWHILVQVCRRWRQIILASPRRLDLSILCTDGTPVRKNLGIWPAIPIVIQYPSIYRNFITPDNEDNVIAALEHADRVCRISLRLTGSESRDIMAAVMQEPFPVLSGLRISGNEPNENAPVIPSGFLGGSAPCLQTLELFRVAFPALPTLLLSASDLVVLRLDDIPLAGYISPEVMVTHLAALPRLKTLHIEYQLATPLPDYYQMRLPPRTRTALPALRSLYLSGVCGYLEDFVARIDVLQLDSIWVYYSDQDAGFDVPQLSEFINRLEIFKDTPSSHCHIKLRDYDQPGVYFCIGGGDELGLDGAERWDINTDVSVGILSRFQGGIHREVWHLTRVLGLISSVLSDMNRVAIHSTFIGLEFLDNIDWLPLLLLFSSAQTLFVSSRIAGHIFRTLEDIAKVPSLVAQVLPALELLCLEDHSLSSVDQFITVRRDSGHPVTIVNTEKNFEEKLKSYP